MSLTMVKEKEQLEADLYDGGGCCVDMNRQVAADAGVAGAAAGAGAAADASVVAMTVKAAVVVYQAGTVLKKQCQFVEQKQQPAFPPGLPMY